MSDIIKLLPDHIANQIAAGEVIQRPSSVVKEMVENAIDAGATKIDVYIKDAGKTLIQIVDNGKGMSTFDSRMCFERHATSKVSKAEDLFTLTTKGFRGEALASVAAIAHVTLQTKLADEEIGNLIQIEGSKITKQEPIVCSKGTSFEVKNLFYNVPARRNFLKTESIEFRHILDDFERIALAHPDIAFSLKHNESQVYNLPSVNLKKRIVDILGKNSAEKLVPIDESTDIVEIIGFVGKPEFAKKKRGEQFLFVNDRYFKDSFFNHAITQAFEGLILPKTYPTYFLYLSVNPQKIDVNVHPTKTEIKFEEDRLIYAIILSSVKRALGKYNIAPTLDFSKETSFDIPQPNSNLIQFEPQIKVNKNYNPFNVTSNSTKSSYTSDFSTAIKSQGFGNNDIKKEDWENFYSIKEEVTENIPLKLDLEIEETSTKSYLLRGNYIFTTTKSGLLIIHHRRANERILYDRMMSLFISQPINAQKLLFPYEKEVSSAEKNEWTSNELILNRLGFEVEFTDKLMQVNAIPSVLQEENINECIDTILENISYRQIEKGDIAHILIHSIAKTSSQKKNPTLTNEVCETLINELFLCEEHTFTPDGRLILQNVALNELTNNF